jgi:hypothetical protein
VPAITSDGIVCADNNPELEELTADALGAPEPVVRVCGVQKLHRTQVEVWGTEITSSSERS